MYVLYTSCVIEIEKKGFVLNNVAILKIKENHNLLHIKKIECIC